jgi:RNA polymerase sigma factor (sigma-70 family)
VYNVSKALEKYRGLIRWTARKYTTSGNFRMSVKDLEAEGLLILVKCCRSFPEGQGRFGRYFKRAWYNHLKTMIRFGRWQKRTGKEVEIDAAIELTPQESVDQKFFERMRTRANELNPYLSQEARRFLRMLVEPSEEVMDFAWRDYCRKRKLLSQGAKVLGGKKFRIRIRHIRGTMGVTNRRMRELVREIRSVNSQLRMEERTHE